MRYGNEMAERRPQIANPTPVQARYLKINKLCEKWAKNAVFEKLCLTEFCVSFTFGVPQSYVLAQPGSSLSVKRQM